MFSRIRELLKARGMDDVLLFGGGIIPREDVSFLQEIGVRGIFTPGATTGEIVDFVRREVGTRRRESL